MTREEVFALVNAERDSQDSLWPRDERRKQMYSFSAPHVLLVQQKADQLGPLWYKGEVTPSDFVKLAALAIRALEEITDPVFLEGMRKDEPTVKRHMECANCFSETGSYTCVSGAHKATFPKHISKDGTAYY